MISTLKKLEATDGGQVTVIAPEFYTRGETAEQASATPRRSTLTVPRSGWLDGPGRSLRYA